MKRHIKTFSAVAWFALSLLGLSCSTTPEAPPSNDLRGMVYNLDRMPVSDMTVSWIQKGINVGSATTDLHGRFLIPHVPFGPITLSFSKQDYEPLVWTFHFTQASQVLYTKIANKDELYNLVSDALISRDWSRTDMLLKRIQNLNQNDEIGIYLHAQELVLQGNWQEGVTLFQSLEKGRPLSFPIEMTLADLYQYRLKQPEKAIQHLKLALKVRGDADAQQRLLSLSKKP